MNTKANIKIITITEMTLVHILIKYLKKLSVFGVHIALRSAKLVPAVEFLFTL